MQHQFLDLFFAVEYQPQTLTELISHHDIGVLFFALKTDRLVFNTKLALSSTQ